MKISFESKSPKADVLVVFAAEGAKLLGAAVAADKKAGGALKRAAEADKFTGKKNQTLVVPGVEGLPHSACRGCWPWQARRIESAGF
ncbi:MAG: M17 family peptidase N-terminal domain-containing protein [Micavibrio sp.]|nr:M17 family peptidase N-terminal domain-containing protein [Micavibrio sp.]